MCADTLSKRLEALDAQLRENGIEPTDAFETEVSVALTAMTRPLRVLELFSGTGSVGKVCKQKGWEVVSVDLDERADITVDIMEWDYKSVGLEMRFDVVWASPPCTMYSKFQCVHDPDNTRDLGPSNELVQKTIEIITFFKPRYWFIENPQTGVLKDQTFMQTLPYHDVDYCMYGYVTRKRTRIWTNYTEFVGKLCDETCGAYGDNRSPRYARGHPELPNTLDKRHAIPPRLIRDLMGFA